MTEIELSVMEHIQGAEQRLRPLLDQFEKQYQVRVNVSVLQWETGWTELVKMALRGHGPDVSEIGSTWVNNLGSLDCLRSFLPMEVYSLGGAEAFVPAAWRSCQTAGGTEIWAMPWVADTRLIYYRRDLLEQVGLDPATAFATSAALADTLARLQQAGVFSHPWSVSVGRSPMVMHTLASWVWGAGGDFISPDGKRVLFAEPAALAGLKEYFDLRHYLIRPTGPFSADSVEQYLVAGQTAVIVSGPWAMLVQPTPRPALVAHWGVACVPGVPFVGGTNLVMWKHTRHPMDALQLVRFLTNQAPQVPYTHHAYLLPPRRAMLATIAANPTDFEAVVIRSLEAGRSFANVKVWGLVEDQLTQAFSQIWETLLAQPAADTLSVLQEHLEPLARRLELKLEA